MLKSGEILFSDHNDGALSLAGMRAVEIDKVDIPRRADAELAVRDLKGLARTYHRCFEVRVSVIQVAYIVIRQICRRVRPGAHRREMFGAGIPELTGVRMVGDDLSQRVVQVCLEELVPLGRDVMHELLEEHAAGGVRGDNHAYSLFDAAVLYRRPDLLRHVYV